MYCQFCEEEIEVIITADDGERRCGLVPKKKIQMPLEEDYYWWYNEEIEYQIDCPYEIYGKSIRIQNNDPFKLPLIFGEIRVNGCIGED